MMAYGRLGFEYEWSDQNFANSQAKLERMEKKREEILTLELGHAKKILKEYLMDALLPKLKEYGSLSKEESARIIMKAEKEKQEKEGKKRCGKKK